jgi:hypothetical protein
MYAVTLNELKAVLKLSAQEGQCGAVNKTSAESTAQDYDFQEVKRRKRHISNDTSQSTMKSTKSFPTSEAVKLPPKAVVTRDFFAHLATNNMDTETTGAENTLAELKASREPGRPTPIVTSSNTNLIRLQSDLKEQVKGEYEFRNTQNKTCIINKRNVGVLAMKSYMEKKCPLFYLFPKFRIIYKGSNLSLSPRHASGRCFQQP